eukprot:2435063-Pyramimonas_sp.AAC.1
MGTIGFTMGARERCARADTSTSWPPQNKVVGRSTTLRTAVRAGCTQICCNLQPRILGTISNQ